MRCIIYIYIILITYNLCITPRGLILDSNTNAMWNDIVEHECGGDGDSDYEDCTIHIIEPGSSRPPDQWYNQRQCLLLQRESIQRSGYEEFLELKTLNMTLKWSNKEDHAAAALLRAVLISVGYTPDGIQLVNQLEPSAPDTLAVKVTVTSLRAYLYVYLSQRARTKPQCEEAVLDWSTSVMSRDILQDCDFLISQKIVPFYIREGSELQAPQVIQMLDAYTYIRSPNYKIVQSNRSELLTLVHKKTHSIILLDNNTLETSTDAQVLRLPLCKPEDNCENVLYKTMTHIDSKPSLLPSGLSEIFAIFSPSEKDLDQVIHYSAKSDTFLEAGCETTRYYREKLYEWRSPAVQKLSREQHWIAVVIQVTFINLPEYFKLVQLLQNIEKIKIVIFVTYRSEQMTLLNGLVNANDYTIEKLSGLVLSSDMADNIEKVADQKSIPVITYDVGRTLIKNSKVVPVTGSLLHMVNVLHRLLTYCDWRRLGILSKTYGVFSSLTAELQALDTERLIREVHLKKNKIRDSLKQLIDWDVRVIIVNTYANLVSTVMRIAQKMNMTREAGYVWIVREYNDGDGATRVTRPLSVSYSWRGDVVDAGQEVPRGGEKDLRSGMEEMWRGRAWPLHATSLVDALLTVAAQEKHGFFRSWTYSYILKSGSVPSVVQNLTYNNYRVVAPLVFVEEWGEDPRPRLLATWRGGDGLPPGEGCPVSDPAPDGTVRCYLSTGNAFHPTCWDAVWITTTSLSILLLITISLVVMWWHRRALKARERRTKTEFSREILALREGAFSKLTEHLVDRSNLEIGRETGTGRFGRVCLGTLRSKRSQNTITVAVKTLKEDASSSAENEFLKEACTLCDLDHEHIVRFLGICAVDGPPLILMEYAFFGDLLNYLKRRRYLIKGKSRDEEIGLEERVHVSAEGLTKLAREAAEALAYLAERNLVHRDARAANCLVDQRRSLKLADFGLARATGIIDGEYTSCRRGLFPVLWMAPESLVRGVFSAPSDVWSFGVLVFEVVTLGRRPYGTKVPASVLQHVMAGGRPRVPLDASVETRALVRACWRREPEHRASAATLARWLAGRPCCLTPALSNDLVDIDAYLDEHSDLIITDFAPDQGSQSLQTARHCERLQ